MSGGQVTGPDLGLATSYDSGVLPVNNDLVSVPGTNNNPIIIDSIAHLAGLDMDVIATEPGFVRSFGTSATAIEGACDLLNVRGGGGFFFECHNGGGSLKVDKAIIRAANASTEIILGSVTGSKGDWVDIDHERGKLTLAGNIQFDANAVVRVGGANPGDTFLAIDSGAGTLSILKQASGGSELRNVVTNLTLSGVGTTCDKHTTKAIKIVLLPGTTLNYFHKAVGGDVLLVEVWPGATFNLMASNEPKTIDKVVRMKGGHVRWIDDPKMHVITDFQDHEKL